ncbi:GntR family transcriptional regulator [Kibdelosporangium philippinense]|uniref:GntR family transcriptional regulator n=1 Tax=Kibdelosporangium philippinense TaxID=211113 RepID=A0ABS8Z7G9_9PSEU|nr:GntR family transcriptional regulator [Kibdelosporangium philippinense]MCE7002606.1 GntR family transcriptional regulator [Kibdelosporangium philippinense]
MTRILVDPDNGVPPWRQVRDQLVRLIQSGELAIGTPLPSIRQLANDLGLSAGTVARVYRELETAGVLHTARRKGTVIAAVPSSGADALTDAAAQFVSQAKALGADLDKAIEAVSQSWE